MRYESEFKLGEVVYLKTDREQKERIVTGVMFSQAGLLYRLAIETNDAFHYELEITKDRDIVKATTG